MTDHSAPESGPVRPLEPRTPAGDTAAGAGAENSAQGAVLRERYAAAFLAAHQEWVRPGSASGQGPLYEAMADAMLAVRDEELERLAAENAALREVSFGYCPHCGRGDAGPTAEMWLGQWRRAEAAETALARVRELHQPVQCMAQTWCGACSIRRSTGPTTDEWVAYIPHPCPTLAALDGPTT